MADHPVIILTVLGGLAAGGVIAVMHVVCSRIRHDVSMHELRRRVTELQSEVANRERDQKEREFYVGVIQDDASDLAA